MTVTAAQAAFFEHAGLGADGGYNAAWFRVETWPFPVYLPNFRGRVAAAKLHDLHHIVTGYRTDWVGEAEIAAWEIAGGCGRYAWAWVLNLGAFLIGMVRAPRRLFAAFVSGRRARNLYHRRFRAARPAEMTVGSLRRELRWNPSPGRPTLTDVAAFLAWSGFAALWHAMLAGLMISAFVALKTGIESALR